MSAEDPTKSPIGHGALGFRSGLRELLALTAEPVAQKHVFIATQGGRQLAGWEIHSGAAWKKQVGDQWQGKRLDVVSVRTNLPETLVRVESLALCISTAGTFYINGATSSGDAYWDDGVHMWDDGVHVWDTGLETLYVHLTGDADPNALDVIGLFGFYVGNVGVTQPVCGAEKVTDPGIENWTNPTTPVSYGFTANTGWTLSQLTSGLSPSTNGLSGARISNAGADLGTGTNRGFLTQTEAVVADVVYRFRARYRTNDVDMSGDIRAFFLIRQSAGTPDILADGVNTAAAATANFIPLESTFGDWRYFEYFCLIPATWTSVQIRLGGWNVNDVATFAMSIDFDDVSFQPVWRFEFHEPLVSLESLPKSTTARQDSYFGRWTVGNGTVILNNGDGQFQDLFSRYSFQGNDFVIRYGGRFSDDGDEILDGEMPIGFPGRAETVAVSAVQAEIGITDVRTLFSTKLPLYRLGQNEYPNMAAIDEGRANPIILGTVTHVKPARVSKNDNEYGVYLILDPRYIVSGDDGWTLDNLWSYASEEAAAKEDALRRVLSDASAVVTGSGIFEVDNSIQILEVLKGENDLIDFSQSPIFTPELGVVAPGVYTVGPGASETQIRAAIYDALAGFFSVTFNDVDKNFRITRILPATTWRAYFDPATAPNRDRSVMPLIGFRGNTDLTGSRDYEGDVIFSDCDSQHIIRVDVQGYKDDGSGTYTGSAGAAISLGGDCLYFLMRKVMGIDPSRLNVASVAAVRATTPQAMGIYLGTIGEDQLELGEIVHRIENGTGLELRIDGMEFKWAQRDNSAAGAVTLQESDFIADTFRWFYVAEDLAQTCIVEYGQDPSTGQIKTRQVSASLVNTLYRVSQSRSFRTFLTESIDVDNCLARFAQDTSRQRRHFTFLTKSKLIRKIVDDKVVIDYPLEVGDELVTARIISLSQDFQTYVSEVECVEVFDDE